MKHSIFAAAFLGLATPLAAETYLLPAPVTAATLYAQGATLTRITTFTVPAGRHELLIANLPESLDPASVRVALEGVTLGAVTVRNGRNLPIDTPDSPDLVAAKAELARLQDDLQATEDARADVLIRVEAAEARLRFLANLEGSADGATAETLLATLSLISQETAAARREATAARRDARQFDDTLADTHAAILDAEQTIKALSPTAGDTAMLAISVAASAATEGTLTLTHQAYDAAWTPTYDLHLSDQDTPSLSLERGAFITQNTGEDWTDVALTLSTSRPDAQTAPSEIYPWLRRIFEPRATPFAKSAAQADSLQEMQAAPVLAMERAAPDFSDGVTATYVYPAAVSITSDSDALRLAMDTLTFTPETYALANPMADSTAFYMAEFTNNSGNALLPSYETNMFLNGIFVGQQEMPLLAEGAQTAISFGPIIGLALSHTVSDRITGDTGVITSRNEQSETRRLSVENLTERSWNLRLLGRIPYSEQEDLVISHRAVPVPTETAYDDKKGVFMWRTSLPPSQRFDVTLTHTLQWPKEMELR